MAFTQSQLKKSLKSSVIKTIQCGNPALRVISRNHRTAWCGAQLTLYLVFWFLAKMQNDFVQQGSDADILKQSRSSKLRKSKSHTYVR